MKILVVDDHAVVRRGARELLAEEFPDAAFDEAATGEDAVARAAETAFDLVVLDLSMPRRGGLEALQDLRASRPAMPVLVLSHHAEEQYAVRAFRAGARGYITKESAPEELIGAARRVLAGGKYVSPALAEQLAAALADGGHAPPHETLSHRELQVLRMIALGKAVKQIAAELALSDKTVSTYRARVLEKMKMESNADLMRYALRAGLVE
jgi:two-component system invasion response regulator UvrY